MRAVIFANGSLNNLPDIRASLRTDDLIIAANGGAHHCLSLAINPTVLIGDFDSLSQEDQTRLQTAGTLAVHHPVDKDQTDLELAIEYACAAGVDEILIYGGIGTRWDQSLANFLLLVNELCAALSITLVDGPQSAQPLRDGQTLTLNGQPGDTVSLIPLTATARGINTHGLAYPLNEVTLHFGSTLGISNSLTANQATITLTEGLLLCILIHGPLEEIESPR